MAKRPAPNPLKELHKHGQSVWLDYIRRDLLTSGRLKQMVGEGLGGMTSNPSIFHQAIARSSEYDDALRAILRAEPRAGVQTIYERLAVEDIRMAADVLRPVYDATGGTDGMVSLEASPHLAGDAPGTLAEARRLWQTVDRPNLMIKVPATPQGVTAFEQLTAEGINVNVTLMFSMLHYEAVSQAYIRGLAASPEPQRVTSIASFFVSRVDTYVDRELEKLGTAEALALRGKAAIANCKLVYRRFLQVFHGEDFTPLRRRGGRIQRVLWGSTSTKNPAYSDVLYVEGLIGEDTVNTLPPETLDAFRRHGRIANTLEQDLDSAEETLAALGRLGVDLDAITEQLQADGVKAFADAFDQLLASLEDKRKSI